MNSDLVSPDAETRLRATAIGLGVEGAAGMSLAQLDAALADYTAMRMRETALGRAEDASNSPSRHRPHASQ